MCLSINTAALEKPTCKAKTKEELFQNRSFYCLIQVRTKDQSQRATTCEWNQQQAQDWRKASPGVPFSQHLHLFTNLEACHTLLVKSFYSLISRHPAPPPPISRLPLGQWVGLKDPRLPSLGLSRNHPPRPHIRSRSRRAARGPTLINKRDLKRLLRSNKDTPIT